MLSCNVALPPSFAPTGPEQQGWEAACPRRHVGNSRRKSTVQFRLKCQQDLGRIQKGKVHTQQKQFSSVISPLKNSDIAR